MPCLRLNLCTHEEKVSINILNPLVPSIFLLFSLRQLWSTCCDMHPSIFLCTRSPTLHSLLTPQPVPRRKVSINILKHSSLPYFFFSLSHNFTSLCLYFYTCMFTTICPFLLSNTTRTLEKETVSKDFETLIS